MSRTSAIAAEGQFLPPICSIFRRFLKRSGLKFTTERARILDAVLRQEGLFDADELLNQMRQAGHRVSKATIYRTLKHLQESKIISEVLLDSKYAHYELSFGRAPQGHLVCVETGRVIEIPSPWLEPMRDQICRKHGFDPVSHRLVIYGISPEAKRAGPQEP
jgi:Fur family ferric uptake transcriptional regulator